MKNNARLRRLIIKGSLFCFVVLILNTFSVYSEHNNKINEDTLIAKQNNKEDSQVQIIMPLSFNTPMGIPLNVGMYSIKGAVLPTRIGSNTNAQYNFQVETGLSKTVGLVLGGKALFYDPTIEESVQFPVINTMVQFLDLKSENGKCGFSPFIEFEFPWWKEHSRRVYALIGFAVTLSNLNLSYNQVIHYNPVKNLTEGDASLIVKLSKRIFFVTEIEGINQKGAGPAINILGGLKVKIVKNFLLGFAYQMPLTNNRDYNYQYTFQPDVIINGNY